MAEWQFSHTQVIGITIRPFTLKTYKYFLFWNVWPNCHSAIFNKKDMKISEQPNGELYTSHSAVYTQTQTESELFKTHGKMEIWRADMLSISSALLLSQLWNIWLPIHHFSASWWLVIMRPIRNSCSSRVSMVTTWPPSDKHLKRNNNLELKYNQGRIQDFSKVVVGNLFFGEFFLKNCMKMQKIGPGA